MLLVIELRTVNKENRHYARTIKDEIKCVYANT